MPHFHPLTLDGYSPTQIAHELAWKVMRKEMTRDELEPLANWWYSCVIYDGLLDTVYAILDGRLTPEEESPRGAEQVPLLRAMFRKEFLLNPDPKKRAWNAFLVEFHKANDPTGLTVAEGLSFRPGVLGEEAFKMADRLNRFVREARRDWDFPLRKGPRFREGRDIDAINRMNAMVDDELVPFVVEWGCGDADCYKCSRHAMSLLGTGRPKALRRIWAELERRES